MSNEQNDSRSQPSRDEPRDTGSRIPGDLAEAGVDHTTPGESPAPHLPNDRDEVVGMTDGVPSPQVQQAARDLEDGRQDTSRAAESDRAYEGLRD